MPQDDVVPDTKDWTWVLQRPCEECGFDATGLPAAEVPAMARSNAAAWRDVLARPDVRDRPRAGVWSPLEYAAHVRDVHRVYDGRLQRMLTEDDPLFENWDQDATALAERYAELDPGTVADELEAAAATIADRFAGVSGAQWQRPGRRSDGARFTVESIARYFAHDWVHHLHDVGGRPT